MKVERGADEQCWPWIGGKATGYGRFEPDATRHPPPRRQVAAHRFAYELLVGPIPEGLTLDHLCGNTLCVNPAHLEPTTMRENILRGVTSAAAVNARKTHCSHGHPYDDENTYLVRTQNGTVRKCRTCDLERKRRGTEETKEE